MRKFLVLAFLFWPTLAFATPENILNWVDNSTDETSFKIFRTTAVDIPNCQTATNFTFLAAVGANITTYTDFAVLEGVTYCYYVVSSNAEGDSEPSNIEGHTVPFEPCVSNTSGIVLVSEPCGPIIH